MLLVFELFKTNLFPLIQLYTILHSWPTDFIIIIFFFTDNNNERI